MAITRGHRPDFVAETPRAASLQSGWRQRAVLFSHPPTSPICTTESATGPDQAGSSPSRRKIIGLSVDPLENHETCPQDIAEIQGTAPNYQMIADTDFNVAQL